MIVITVTSEGSEPDLYKLDQDRIRLGREPDNDVVLPSKTCSRYHAEILRSHDTYKIVDCGSTNGIKIGPEKLPEVLITHGISVGVGEYTLTFDLSDQQVAKTIRISVPAQAPAAEEPPAAAPPVLYLVYRLRNQTQSIKVVAGVEYLIGRSPGSDLVLEESNVSAQHARIFFKDKRFFVTDLDSANGTLVNRKQVREAPLQDGDIISIGSTTIAVKAERDELADEALLLARTRHIPQQQAQSQADRLAPSGSRVGLYATMIAMVLLVVIVGLVLVTRNRTAETDGPPGAVTAVPGSGSSTSAGEAVVQVAAIAIKEIVAGVSGAGTVKPQQSVTVSAEVAGRIVEMPVSEGEVVSKGQLLARLDDRDLRLRIEEVRSAVSQEQLELARQDYQRKERLFNEGAVTRSIYDQAKGHFLTLDAAYRSNQARLRQLQEQVARTRLTATTSGTVARKLMSQGELVAPGMPVVVIESMDEVLIELEVSDREIVKVRPLQTVEATTDAFPGRVFPGAVEHIGTAANPVTKGFKVEARIGNQDGHLRSGMIASVKVILEKRSGLVVPVEALRERHGDQAEVLVVTDGIAHRIRITLGQQTDREAEVLRGLDEGDEVIVYGHESVADGQPVKVYNGT
jgi:membrane fusion protein (multidrug efflux system)